MLQKLLWVSRHGYFRLQKRKLGNKYDPINLFLETNNYHNLFENEESADTTRKRDKEEVADTVWESHNEESVDLLDMPPPKLDGEEVKGKKRIKHFNLKQTINY